MIITRHHDRGALPIFENDLLCFPCFATLSLLALVQASLSGYEDGGWQRNLEACITRPITHASAESPPMI